MFSIHRQLRRDLFRQRSIAILLIANLLAAVVPIPHASDQQKNLTLKQLSARPFPCQSRLCGCRSADQCRKQCCCFSAAQKRAWAKLHQIDVAEVIPMTKKLPHSDSANAKSCCATKSAQKSAVRPTRNPRRYATGFAAQKCRGTDQSISFLPICVLPSPLPSAASLESVGERVICHEPLMVNPDTEPPIPPPRLTA